MIHDRANPLGLPVTSEFISDDRQCPRCSYQLTGLKTGDRCPECGTPIRGKRRGFAGDSYNEVSLSYLRSLANGTFAMMCGLPCLLGGFVWAAQQGPAGGFVHPAMAVMVTGGAAWAFGVWLVHEVRPGAKAEIPKGAPAGTEAKPEYWRLRIFNRFTQVLWMLGPLLLWMGLSMYGPAGGTMAAPAGLFVSAAGIAVVVAIVGFVTTCYYMSDLATWAYDDVTASRLRFGPIVALVAGIPTGLAATALVVRLMNFGVAPLTLTSFGVMFAVFLVCIAPLVLGLVSFAGLMRWALINRDEALASDRRRSANIVKRIEEGQRPRERERAAGGKQEQRHGH